MEVLHPHCAGPDLLKEPVVACMCYPVDGKVKTDTETFKTATQELMIFSDCCWRKTLRILGWRRRESPGSRCGAFCLTEGSNWDWPTPPA